MPKVRLILATVVALLAPAAFAGGLAGMWTITVENPQGSRTSELTVAEAEGGYAGSLVGQRGTTELQSISVEGDSFSFTLTMETRMGEIELKYSGTVSGDTLSGSIETRMGGRAFTGVRKE